MVWGGRSVFSPPWPTSPERLRAKVLREREREFVFPDSGVWGPNTQGHHEGPKNRAQRPSPSLRRGLPGLPKRDLDKGVCRPLVGEELSPYPAQGAGTQAGPPWKRHLLQLCYLPLVTST